MARELALQRVTLALQVRPLHPGLGDLGQGLGEEVIEGTGRSHG